MGYGKGPSQFVCRVSCVCVFVHLWFHAGEGRGGEVGGGEGRGGGGKRIPPQEFNSFTNMEPSQPKATGSNLRLLNLNNF